jgi:outer membrane autotransporter protein
METAPAVRKGRTEVFATAHTHTAGVDNSTTNAGYDTDMNGATAGMRYDVNGNIHLGGYIGVDDGTISGNLIDADAHGYVIGTFSNYQFEDSGRTSIFGSLSYGDYSHDTLRRSFGGDVTADGIASDAFEFLIGTSTVVYEKEGFLISPSASFRYMSGSVDSFTESGAGVPLTVESQDFDSLLLDVGVDFTYEITERFSVGGRLGYVQELADSDHTVSSTFAASGAAAQDFQVTAPGMDDQAITLGAGLFYDVSDAVRVGATYRGEFGSDSQPSQSIGLGATFAF